MEHTKEERRKELNAELNGVYEDYALAVSDIVTYERDKKRIYAELQALDNQTDGKPNKTR